MFLRRKSPGFLRGFFFFFFFFFFFTNGSTPMRSPRFRPGAFPFSVQHLMEHPDCPICEELKAKSHLTSSHVTKADYKRALAAQAACNLSGVVFALARSMERICAQANEEGRGTDWRNSHPIARLYAEQISHLTRHVPYLQAHAACEEEVS